MLDSLFTSSGEETSVPGLSECLIFPGKELEMQRGCLFGCTVQFREVFEERNILKEPLFIKALAGSKDCMEQWLRVSGPACCALWIDLSKHAATRDGFCTGELNLAYRLRSYRSHYRPLLIEAILVLSVYEKTGKLHVDRLKSLTQEQAHRDPLENWEGLRQREKQFKRSRSESSCRSKYPFAMDAGESVISETCKRAKRWLGIMTPLGFKQLLSMIDHGGILSLFRDILRQLVEIPQFLDLKCCMLDFTETLKLQAYCFLLSGLDMLVVTRGPKWAILRLDCVENVLKIAKGIDVGIVHSCFGCENPTRLSVSSSLTDGLHQAVEDLDQLESACISNKSAGLEWMLLRESSSLTEVQELGPVGALLMQTFLAENSELIKEEAFAESLKWIAGCWKKVGKKCNHRRCTSGATVYELNAKHWFSEVAISAKEKYSLSHLHSNNKEVRRRGVCSLLNMLLGGIKEDLEQSPVWLTGLGNKPTASIQSPRTKVVEHLSEHLSDRREHFDMYLKHEIHNAMYTGNSPGGIGWVSLVEWLDNGFLEVLITEAVLCLAAEKEDEDDLDLQKVTAGCLRVLDLAPGESAYLFVDVVLMFLQEFTDASVKDLNSLQSMEVDVHRTSDGLDDKGRQNGSPQRFPCPSQWGTLEHPEKADLLENRMRERQLHNLQPRWRLSKLLSAVTQGSSIVAAVIAKAGGLSILLELFNSLIKLNGTLTSLGPKISSTHDLKSEEICILPGETLLGENLPLKINSCLGTGWPHSNSESSDSREEPNSFSVAFSEYQKYQKIELSPILGQRVDWHLIMEQSEKQDRAPVKVQGQNLSDGTNFLPLEDGREKWDGQNKQSATGLWRQERPQIPKLDLKTFGQSFHGRQGLQLQAQLGSTTSDTSSSGQCTSLVGGAFMLPRRELSDVPRVTINWSNVVYDAEWALLFTFSKVLSNNSLCSLSSRDKLRQTLSGKRKLQLADSFVRFMIGPLLHQISHVSNFSQGIVFKVVFQLDKENDLQSGCKISSIQENSGSLWWRGPLHPLLLMEIARHLSNALEGRLQQQVSGDKCRKRCGEPGDSAYSSPRVSCMCSPGAHERRRQVEAYCSKLWVTVGGFLQILAEFIYGWPATDAALSVINCCGRQIELVFKLLAESDGPAGWKVGQVLAMHNLLVLVAAATSEFIKKRSSTEQDWSALENLFWQTILECKSHWECTKSYTKWIMFDACEACLQSLAEGYRWSFDAEPEHIAFKCNACAENVCNSTSNAQPIQKQGTIFFLKAMILLIQRKLACHQESKENLSLLMPQSILSLLDFMMDPVDGLLMKIFKGSSYSNVTQTERITGAYRGSLHLQDNLLLQLPLCTQREFIAKPGKLVSRPVSMNSRQKIPIVNNTLDTGKSGVSTNMDSLSLSSDEQHSSLCEESFMCPRQFLSDPNIQSTLSNHAGLSAVDPKSVCVSSILAIPSVSTTVHTAVASLIHESAHLEAMIFGLNFGWKKDVKSYPACEHHLAFTNPFLSSKYVDPFLNYHFLCFLRLYNVGAPPRCIRSLMSKSKFPLQKVEEAESTCLGVDGTISIPSNIDDHLFHGNDQKTYFIDSPEDEEVSLDCILHIEVLLALAKNQTEDVNLRFKQLKVMEFLVHQIALEYEASHVATPRDMFTSEQIEMHQLKATHVENSSSPSMKLSVESMEASTETIGTSVAKQQVCGSCLQNPMKLLNEKAISSTNPSRHLSYDTCFDSSLCSSSLATPSSRRIKEESLLQCTSNCTKYSSRSYIHKDSQMVYSGSNKNCSDLREQDKSLSFGKVPTFFDMKGDDNLSCQGLCDAKTSDCNTAPPLEALGRRLLEVGPKPEFPDGQGRSGFKETVVADSNKDCMVLIDALDEKSWEGAGMKYFKTKPIYSGRFFDLNEEVERELAEEDLKLLVVEENAGEDSGSEIQALVLSPGDIDSVHSNEEKDEMKPFATTANKGQTATISTESRRTLVRPVVPRLDLPKSARKGEQELSSEKVSFERVATHLLVEDLKCQKLTSTSNNDRGCSADDVLSTDTSGSTEKTFKSGSPYYEFERSKRRIYRSPSLHVLLLELYMSLMLNPQGTLEACYSDRFHTEDQKLNASFFLFYHLNHPANSDLFQCLCKRMKSFHPSILRILKLSWKALFNPSIYKSRVRIAHGAFAKIYEATFQTQEEDSRKLVILKTVDLPKGPHDPGKLLDIYSEVQILETFLGEQRVCQLLDYGVDSESFVLVLKHYKCSLRAWRQRHMVYSVASETFEQNLKSRKAGQSFLERLPLYLEVFAAVLHAVKVLETHNVVHYDLKCDNILLEPINSSILEEDFWDPLWPPLDASSKLPFMVSITDFGQSKASVFKGGECTFRNRGTEYVKSPEMLKLLSNSVCSEFHQSIDLSRECVGKAVDVWGLGCLLYELLVGEYLLYDEDWMRFFVHVTLSSEELITSDKAEKVENNKLVLEFLRFVLVRDPLQRPSLDDLMIHLEHLQSRLEWNDDTVVSECNEVPTVHCPLPELLDSEGCCSPESNADFPEISENWIMSSCEDKIIARIPPRHIDKRCSHWTCCCCCGQFVV